MKRSEIYAAVPNDQPSVYFIRNTQTGKVYVGASLHPAQRIYDQLLNLRGAKVATVKSVYNSALWAEFKQYGEAAFECGVLEAVNPSTDQRLREREAYWIEHYRAKNLCYNKMPSTYRGVKQAAQLTGKNQSKRRTARLDIDFKWKPKRNKR